MSTFYTLEKRGNVSRVKRESRNIPSLLSIAKTGALFYDRSWTIRVAGDWFYRRGRDFPTGRTCLFVYDRRAGCVPERWKTRRTCTPTDRDPQSTLSRVTTITLFTLAEKVSSQTEWAPGFLFRCYFARSSFVCEHSDTLPARLPYTGCELTSFLTELILAVGGKTNRDRRITNFTDRLTKILKIVVGSSTLETRLKCEDITYRVSYLYRINCIYTFSTGLYERLIRRKIKKN